MTKTTDRHIVMADAHAKSALANLTAIQASRGISTEVKRAVSASIESNNELIRFIGVIRTETAKADPLNISSQGGEA